MILFSACDIKKKLNKYPSPSNAEVQVWVELSAIRSNISEHFGRENRDRFWNWLLASRAVGGKIGKAAGLKAKWRGLGDQFWVSAVQPKGWSLRPGHSMKE